MKIVLIDDEKKSTEMLKIELERLFPFQHQIFTYNHVEKAEAGLDEVRPDLVFLDVDMPKKDGFELLKSTKDLDFEVVFATAYSRFAIQAIKQNACDYILKPFETIEIKEAVEKAEKNISSKTALNQTDLLLKLVTSQRDKKIKVPTSKGITFISPSDIIYCKSESNYVHIITVNQTVFIAKTLKYIHSLLNQSYFVRVHNSIVVNEQHVAEYVKSDGGYLLMSNGDKVKVSSSKRNLLEK